MLSSLPLIIFLPIALGQAISGLYGFDPWNELRRINPTDGLFTNISNPLPPQEIQSQGLSALDSENRIFYLVGFNVSYSISSLYGISLDDGSVISEARLPFVQEVAIGVGESMAYDPKTGLCLVLGSLRNSPHANHTLIAVDAVSGVYQEVATLVADTVIIASPSTFDWKNRVFITIYGGSSGADLYLANVDNGQVKTVPMTQQFQSLAYNDLDGFVYGFGISGSTRTVLRFDTSTFQTQLLGVLTDYFVLYGGLSTLDTPSRILYGLLQPTNGPSAQYRLVGVGIDNAVVETNPLACNGLKNEKTDEVIGQIGDNGTLDLPYCLFQLQYLV